MDNKAWRAFLEESRARQAQLNQQNYAMPSQGWQDPQSMGPMQGNSGAGWGADIPAGPTDFSQDPSYYRQAPGYRPGMGSMTPQQQMAADDQWEQDFQAKQAMLNQIPQHVPWGDPRIQQVMNNAPTDAQAYNAYPSFGAPTPEQGPGRKQAQLADWERYQQIMAMQRPNQGLR